MGDQSALKHTVNFTWSFARMAFEPRISFLSSTGSAYITSGGVRERNLKSFSLYVCSRAYFRHLEKSVSSSYLLEKLSVGPPSPRKPTALWLSYASNSNALLF